MSGLEIIGGLITLAIAIVAWIRSANDKRAKDRSDEDKRIDAANNADDLLREFDRMRRK